MLLNLPDPQKDPIMWQEIKTAGPIRSMLAFAAGVLVTLVTYLLRDIMRTGLSVMDKEEIPSRGSWLIQLLSVVPRLFMKINSWPWIALVFVIFAALTIQRRREEKGWVFALTAGVAFMETQHQAILRL